MAGNQTRDYVESACVLSPSQAGKTNVLFSQRRGGAALQTFPALAQQTLWQKFGQKHCLLISGGC